MVMPGGKDGRGNASRRADLLEVPAILPCVSPEVPTSSEEGGLAISGKARGTGRRLTHRENQVAALIADGLSDKEIARKLGIYEGTVKVYTKNIRRHLGVNNRVKVALWWRGVL